MSRIRFGFADRKLRAAGLASIMCIAVLSLPGCFRATSDTYVVTPDYPGLLYTIKKFYSDHLVWMRQGPDCAKDVSGDGTVGSNYDRTACAFFIIRVLACNKLSGGPHNICYAATDANNAEERHDFEGAVLQQLGEDDCLALHVGSNVEGPYNWTARRLGTGGCVQGP